MTFSLLLGLGGCVAVTSQRSKGKDQEPAALDHSPVSSVLSEQVKKHLEDLDAIIKTMSLEELLEIVMIDVEDTHENTTSIEEKEAYMRQKLSSLPLVEAQHCTSEAYIKGCLISWKGRDVTFILSKYLNLGEQLKVVTNDKVRRFVELSRAVLKAYMS